MKNYPLLLLLLLFLYTSSVPLFAAKVDTVQTFSKVMNKEIPAVIITPDAYNKETNFPVVYLLHGYSADYGGYVDFSDVTGMADQYNFIVVCPDGNYSSWYYDSPMDSTSRYETYVAQELVEWVDNHYKTLAFNGM